MYDVESNVNSNHGMKYSEQSVNDQNEEKMAGLKGNDMNGFTTTEVEEHVWEVTSPPFHDPSQMCGA